MDIDKKLEILINQQAQAKELFFKCQGAIEILTEMLEEEKEDKKDAKK